MSANSHLLDLPYAHLNLRRNPFGELSLEEWTALALVDVESVVDRLSDPGYTAQFVGEKGYGKTTHLLAIRGRFAEAGYVHIPEGERAIVPAGRPVLIDEAQRLTFPQRLRLFRSRTPLVLGTHRDFETELRLAGRTVETFQVDASTHVDRICKLLNARVIHVRRGEGAVPTISRTTAAALRREFGPDVRAMLHRMYITFQTLSGVCEV